MANITGRICALFLFVVLTSFRVCEPKKSPHHIKIINDVNDSVNPITEILKTLKTMNDSLNVIKQNSDVIAQWVKNVCPNRYERIVKGCFYVREKYTSSGSLKWISSRLYCQAIDGDLAVVDDIPKFLTYYENQPNVRFQDYHWYGASRIGHTIQYLNGTELPVSSSLWEAGYPGPGNCVALHTSKQKLITADCTKAYSFICKNDQ
ncbi:unnamed protein product [Meganyctiphanes norvegica]|uniref:C-type lectin domain-containing protein n=1 Tax=Meganyctiphanes norvegica TaxID=48144 RepID=A0AAV2Q742_MEGNR